jgi:plastocyanin
MLNKKLVLFTALGAMLSLVAACGGIAPPKGDHGEGNPAPIPASQQPSSAPPVAAPAAAPVTSEKPASNASSGREVTVDMMDESGDYAFGPDALAFSIGETVTLKMTSQNEFHSFTVDSLDIDVEVEAGETSTLTYTFDKAGTYDLICIPHESLGMVGTITVQ